MKEKYLINARIIDPSQKIDFIGGLVIDEKGKIKDIGKHIKNTSQSKKAEIIDIKKKVVIPGIVDLKTFVVNVSLKTCLQSNNLHRKQAVHRLCLREMRGRM